MRSYGVEESWRTGEWPCCDRSGGQGGFSEARTALLRLLWTCGNFLMCIPPLPPPTPARVRRSFLLSPFFFCFPFRFCSFCPLFILFFYFYFSSHGYLSIVAAASSMAGSTPSVGNRRGRGADAVGIEEELEARMSGGTPKPGPHPGSTSALEGAGQNRGVAGLIDSAPDIAKVR